jgi:hypothetical protein
MLKAAPGAVQKAYTQTVQRWALEGRSEAIDNELSDEMDAIEFWAEVEARTASGDQHQDQ